MKKYFTISCCIFCVWGFAQDTRVLLDEDFADWQNVQPAYVDPLGDQPGSPTDFGEFRIWNDEDFLFFSLELNNEINLQDNNGISVYIDTDNNAGTGFSVNSIGADLVYSLGNRQGTIYAGPVNLPVNHADIGLVSSPTVTSPEFEIAISRHVQVLNQDLFSGNDIKVFWRNNELFGDQLPNENNGVAYTFNNGSSSPLPSYSITKANQDHLRMLSYNVLFDGFFDPAKVPAFTRILQAIEPEIICFQEIYSYSSAETANQVETMLPSGQGQQWYHGKAGPDVIVVSRFPVLEVFPIEGVNLNQGNGAFLLDLTSAYGTEMLVLNAHTPCCSNEFERQEEIDALMAFVRDAKSAGGELTLQPNTPVAILGDMNLVGLRMQQTTLLTGDIFNEFLYGNDFQPDWDNTSFEDAKPYTTGMPMTFTWYRENSSFSPGRLDYIVYSGSVMSLQNSYVLFTPGLPSDSLNAYNLLTSDATTAADHLPVVADFEMNMATSTTLTREDFLNFEVFPNPASGKAVARFHLDKQSRIKLDVFDATGKEMITLAERTFGAGAQEVPLDFKGFENGVYFVRMEIGGKRISRQILVSD